MGAFCRNNRACKAGVDWKPWNKKHIKATCLCFQIHGDSWLFDIYDDVGHDVPGMWTLTFKLSLVSSQSFMFKCEFVCPLSMVFVVWTWMRSWDSLHLGFCIFQLATAYVCTVDCSMYYCILLNSLWHFTLGVYGSLHAVIISDETIGLGTWSHVFYVALPYVSRTPAWCSTVVLHSVLLWPWYGAQTTWSA